ncbi:MAG: hypothetical protein GHCLOJNM_01203 [bacterium]|nr:hypothetical protein [bacterium]
MGAGGGAGLGAAAGAGISQLPANRPGEGLRDGERPGADREGVQRREDRRADRPEQLPADWGDRWNNWQEQGDNIRNEWHNEYHNHYYVGGWYDDDWYHFHHHPYYPYYDHCHDCDWWSCPATWAAVGAFVGSVLTPQPVYYTYGSGGTVYVEGDTIILNGSRQVPAETYTQELVNQAQAVPQEASEELQWMPLGVFTIVDEEAPETTMSLQLTVSQTGVIAGMFQNTTTDTTVPVEGSVDTKSSRAVWRPVGKSYPLAETGLYNLIQDQTQILVHFEGGTVEERLLVRLDKPETEGTAAAQGETTPRE